MSQIVILNAGGQYCHLIARRIRELGVRAVVADIDSSVESLGNARGIIISCGPASVNEATSPKVDERIYALGVPILGICYGHQLIARNFGGRVSPRDGKEYGQAVLHNTGEGRILGQVCAEPMNVWMSHGDTVVDVPPDFIVIGETDECKVAAMEHSTRPIFGLQFHPEVAHTEHGNEIIRRFVFELSGCERDWNPRSQLEQVLQQIRARAGERKVFFLISGGVDSTVAFFLCYRALGRTRVRGLYVDTGFMRRGDTKAISKLFSNVERDVIQIADRSDDFFSALAGVVNPEEKRAVIGSLFLKVQAEEFAKLSLSEDEWLLGQGTIYPDTIESGGGRHSARIKTHHNRVPQVQVLIDQGKVIEPLTEFYKDEVRLLGEELGLPSHIVHKHPFPGPGLAVRALCSDREAQSVPVPDNWELPYDVRASIVPLKTVGVQGDERSYAHLLVMDGSLDPESAGRIGRSITNRYRQINRVAFVVYSKAQGEFRRFRIHPATLTRQRIALLRQADAIVTDTIRAAGLYDTIWQFPVGLLPLGLSSGETIILRPIRSRDGMTADVVVLSDKVLKELSNQLGVLDGVDAVLYDVTNKPPATIELE